VSRVRLDQLLVDRGLARSRSEAQSLLMAGEIQLAGSGNRALKPGQFVGLDVELVAVSGPRWASRGGEKLAAALDAFGVDPRGLACLDAGASTGGFTDVLLDRGALVVYAVDVGRGQLVDRLRTDPRVVVIDRTNLRSLEALPEPVQLATLDLSFISLALVLPAVRRLLAAGGRVVALVKPQFEAGRAAVPRGGVVRDPAVHRAVLLGFGDAAQLANFRPTKAMRSPITGSSGNVEFLALLESDSAAGPASDAWPQAVDALFEASD
jgi:23S rRNA (cytidine1920-2'-O)/16S rRNA (cytidine1409-2'-O)-methyltransferase